MVKSTSVNLKVKTHFLLDLTFQLDKKIGNFEYDISFHDMLLIDINTVLILCICLFQVRFQLRIQLHQTPSSTWRGVCTHLELSPIHVAVLSHRAELMQLFIKVAAFDEKILHSLLAAKTLLNIPAFQV